jgi:hypothetical protein
MKKVYVTIAFISAIGMLLFLGCSKENEQKETEQQKVFQPSEQDLQIEGKILAFKQKLDYVRENPNLKSGEDDLTIDEAVWNIEALVNYTYADASADFYTIVNDSVSITVNLIEGRVAINDIIAAYDQIVDSLSAKYNQILSTEKQLMIADVSVKEINEVAVVFEVNSAISSGILNPGGWFGVNDIWFYGMADYNNGGYCGGIYNGTHTNDDAAEQIQRKIMFRRSLPSGHRYFIDIKEVYVDGQNNELIYEPNSQEPILCGCCDIINPNDPIQNDNYYDRLVFFNWAYYQNFHGCLSKDEMNFYLGSMEDIIYDMVFECFADELSGKIFSDCNMYWGLYVINGAVTYYHTNSIHYGISMGSGDPPNEL